VRLYGKKRKKEVEKQIWEMMIKKGRERWRKGKRIKQFQIHLHVHFHSAFSLMHVRTLGPKIYRIFSFLGNHVAL
jgi:hypothetical protein